MSAMLPCDMHHSTAEQSAGCKSTKAGRVSKERKGMHLFSSQATMGILGTTRPTQKVPVELVVIPSGKPGSLSTKISLCPACTQHQESHIEHKSHGGPYQNRADCLHNQKTPRPMACETRAMLSSDKQVFKDMGSKMLHRLVL